MRVDVGARLTVDYGAVRTFQQLHVGLGLSVEN